MKKEKLLKRPKAFGLPNYPSFDFYVQYGTVQITPIRPNAVVWGKDIRKFQRWLDAVKAYSDQENKRLET